MLKLYYSDGTEVTNKYTQHCDRSSCLVEPWCSAWGICKEEGELELTKMQKDYSDDYDLDPDYDKIFLQCSLHEEFSSNQVFYDTISQFALPKSQKEVKEARKTCMPKRSGKI